MNGCDEEEVEEEYTQEEEMEAEEPLETRKPCKYTSLTAIHTVYDFYKTLLSVLIYQCNLIKK